MDKDEMQLADTGVSQISIDRAEVDGKYLSFFTSEQLFGVPIADVVQIVGMQTITEMPEFPPYVKGIINLRGSIIPVIDVRLRLGKPQADYDERTCIIVTMIQEKSFGFIVDAVNEVTEIDDSDISTPPSIQGVDVTNSFLTGIAKLEGHVILLIDTAKILSDDVMDTVTSQI